MAAQGSASPSVGEDAAAAPAADWRNEATGRFGAGQSDRSRCANWQNKATEGKRNEISFRPITAAAREVALARCASKSAKQFPAKNPANSARPRVRGLLTAGRPPPPACAAAPAHRRQIYKTN
jgi:hypothetical protein